MVDYEQIRGKYSLDFKVGIKRPLGGYEAWFVLNVRQQKSSFLYQISQIWKKKTAQVLNAEGLK